MATLTVTVTDITQPVPSLYTLATQGSQTGYTCVPSSPPETPALTENAEVAYLSVQASNLNGAKVVYKGDRSVLANGTRQGLELEAGQVNVMMMYPRVGNLNQIYVTASANGAIFNVEWHHS
jgi:hypothetical protein